MKSTLFDEEFRLEELSKMGDPLEKLAKYSDFESYRELVESVFRKKDPKKGGRPSFDKIMMLKALILRSMYDLSFEKLEFHIKDRLSFQRFLGISLGDKVPDANTFWDFNEAVVQAGVIDQIFIRLRDELGKQGLIMNNGSIVDASIVDAPKQRNSRDENARIKAGKKPEEWSENKSRQKDTDASWTNKDKQSRFGYKNHIKVDKGSKLITNFEVSTASVHDSQMLDHLLEDSDSGHELYADSAYRSKKTEEELKRRKITSRVHLKGYRNKPLAEKDKDINTRKSKIRARVEHVFGDMHQQMGRVMVQQIGMIRNTAAITMMNICYNLRRRVYLQSMSG